MNEIFRIFAAAFDAINPQAEVAESVDASVSKTDEVTLVPVRSRPSVPMKKQLRGAAFSVLFHRHRLGQVARLVDVATSHHGDVVGQNLQRYGGQQWRI